MNDILQYKDYYATVSFSAEDEVFHGKVIGINDLISFEGDSVKTLKDSFVEDVDDYLETCKEIGKQPDKMYKGSFNIRIPAELHKKAAIASASYNMSLNDFMKNSINLALTKREYFEQTCLPQ